MADLAAQTSGRSDANPVQPSGQTKNPAAVALGRLGGLKGGKARAKSLTKQERIKIAQKAANKRWSNKKSSKE